MQSVTEAIITWRDASFPTLQIVTENQPQIDESAMSPIWLDVEFRWYGAKEITIEARPVGRHSGALSCQVYVKEGEGTALASQVLDSLNEAFRSRRVGGGVTKFGQRSVPNTALGWYRTGLFFPFTYDEM